jgi:hypothetical protein
MFVKDSFTCYYTPPVCESLNKQWNETKIKIVLDIVTFLIDNEEASNNVKSLETIMHGIDEHTKSIATEI